MFEKKPLDYNTRHAAAASVALTVSVTPLDRRVVPPRSLAALPSERVQAAAQRSPALLAQPQWRSRARGDRLHGLGDPSVGHTLLLLSRKNHPHNLHGLCLNLLRLRLRLTRICAKPCSFCAFCVVITAISWLN